MNKTQRGKMSEAISASNVEKKKLRCVALIDDAYDPLVQIEFQPHERDDLWGRLIVDDTALEEITQIGHNISIAGELTGDVLASFHENRSECPVFNNAWEASLIGSRIEKAKDIVNRLADNLTREFGLDVRKFGGHDSTDVLIKDEYQLIFIDWYLGDNGDTAIEAAINKAREILSIWPSKWPKPIMVLMSSRPGFREHADEFCRLSGILRGMFYAVMKSELTDLFKLRMHIKLFEMSLPAGRRLQAFADVLHERLEKVTQDFVSGIRELTLNDYAYIQSLSLQDDGQPLGDYLSWLFSTYFGHILFAEALHEQLADLDTMTFTDALPNLGPPSDRLSDLYHCALFDTSVGPTGEHPRTVKDHSDDGVVENLALFLGDVFEYSTSKHEDKTTEDSTTTEFDGSMVIDSEDDHNPDLFLLINPQCDLAFTPDQDKRQLNPNHSILLVPGYRESVLEPINNKGNPRTELYHLDGESYRITWNTRRVLTIPYGQFTKWQMERRYKRVARLRLPYALEVQRAFATDLTRVGMPVMPPIYQHVTARILRVRAQDNTFEETDDLRDDEAVFLILTRVDRKIHQRCVLTMPLVSRLKALLDERLTTLKEELDSLNGGTGSSHLPKKIQSLERAIEDPNWWIPLMSPIDLPKTNGAKKFLGDKIQIVQGKKEGDISDGRAIVAISLNLGYAVY